MKVDAMPEDKAIAPYVAGSLLAAAARDVDGMLGNMDKVAEQYGQEGLARFIILTIDSTLHMIFGDDLRMGERQVELVFTDPSGSQVEDLSVADVSNVWAGRLVAARLAGDEENFTALWSSVPEGKGAEYAVMLVVTCAEAIRVGRRSA